MKSTFQSKPGSILPQWGSTQAVRLIIITFVIGISILLALLFGESKLTLLLLGLVGIAAAVVFIRWPALGVLLATISGLVIPYNGPSGVNATMGLIALLLGLWILDILRDRSTLQKIDNRIIIPAIIFILTIIVSVGVGQLNWYSFAQHAPLLSQLAGGAIYILSIGAFLLAAFRIGSLDWLRWITWIFLGIAAVILLLRLTPGLYSFSTKYISPPGAVFWIWTAAIAFSQGLLNKKLPPWLRGALFVLTLLVIYHMYFQRYTNKSGWVTVFIAVAGVIGSRSLKKSVIIVAIGLFAMLAFNLVATTLGSEEYSYSTRIDAGLILLDMIKVNPLFGLGFANYYWYAPLFSIRGYDVQFSSHNNYLDITAQTGLIGLAVFGWFLAEIGILLLKLRDRVPAGGFSDAYLYGAMGGFSGMLVAGLLADWIMPFFYNIGMHGFRHSAIGWIFLGGVILLARLYPEQEAIST